VIRGEELEDAVDLLGPGVAPDRGPRGEVAGELIRIARLDGGPAQQQGLHDARADGVHEDVVPGVIDGHRPRNLDHRPLGWAVDPLQPHAADLVD
jgi:hypothetical protein